MTTSGGTGEGTLDLVVAGTGETHGMGGTMTTEQYANKGDYWLSINNHGSTLESYQNVISLAREIMEYRLKKARTLMDINRLPEAAWEFEMIICLGDQFQKQKAKLEVASVYFSLGRLLSAKRYIEEDLGPLPDPYDLDLLNILVGKLFNLQNSLLNCQTARNNKNWQELLDSVVGAQVLGADKSFLLLACKTEAYLQLGEKHEADVTLTKLEKMQVTYMGVHPPKRESLFFSGFDIEAYVYYIQAQVHLKLETPDTLP